MLIAILLAAGLAWWMHKRGELLPNLQRILIGGGLALLALRMLETGRIWVAVVVGFGAALWWFGQPKLATARRSTDIAAARSLLGVAPDADSAAIRAAYRHLITSAHPDAGGSAELAAKITAARDLLLGQLANR